MVRDDRAHVTDTVAGWLDLPDVERIKLCGQHRWIGYSRAQGILAEMQRLIEQPLTHRMDNLLIVGETNNGKTFIAHRFLHLHPANEDAEGDASLVPVLIVQAPPRPSEIEFYDAILDRLSAPRGARTNAGQKLQQVVHLLRWCKVRMLVVDEIQHLLAGHQVKQKTFLNVIKYLGNEIKIPIVGIGVKDAYRAIQLDPQLANRFRPMILPRWGLGDDFERLLASFERLLPLKESSGLFEAPLACKLHVMSEGLLGELFAVLTLAARKAISRGDEKITVKTLDAIDWNPPSARKRLLDRLT